MSHHLEPLSSVTEPVESEMLMDDQKSYENLKVNLNDMEATSSKESQISETSNSLVCQLESEKLENSALSVIDYQGKMDKDDNQDHMIPKLPESKSPLDNLINIDIGSVVVTVDDTKKLSSNIESACLSDLVLPEIMPDSCNAVFVGEITNKENEPISKNLEEENMDSNIPSTEGNQNHLEVIDSLIGKDDIEKSSLKAKTTLAENSGFEDSANSCQNPPSKDCLENKRISSPTPPSSPPKSEIISREPHLLHHVKSIQFKDKKLSIITQNENGPCPLVAIINVLLLRRQITLPGSAEIVTASKLMEYIGNAILENVPKNLSGEVQLNYEQNMHDAMAVLPKLQTGLDVNVKFTGVRDFEYTPECIVFDLLRIPLFHGWLVDPQTPEVVSAIGQAGYNQAVEKVISQKCSDDPDTVTEALIIENFLERSASQLTYHGLSELCTKLAEEEVGVLFRNNHFSTIYKHKKELLQLVTDQGFLGEASVVWETLSSIDGDEQFVDGNFRTVPPKPERAGSTAATSFHLSAEQQIDQDFLVALSLQEEQSAASGASGVETSQPSAMTEEDKTTQELLDAELAMQLQEEEERRATENNADRRTSAPNQPSQSENSHSKKKENCNIL